NVVPAYEAQADPVEKTSRATHIRGVKRSASCEGNKDRLVELSRCVACIRAAGSRHAPGAACVGSENLEQVNPTTAFEKSTDELARRGNEGESEQIHSLQRAVVVLCAESSGNFSPSPAKMPRRRSLHLRAVLAHGYPT